MRTRSSSSAQRHRRQSRPRPRPRPPRPPRVRLCQPHLRHQRKSTSAVSTTPWSRQLRPQSATPRRTTPTIRLLLRTLRPSSPRRLAARPFPRRTCRRAPRATSWSRRTRRQRRRPRPRRPRQPALPRRGLPCRAWFPWKLTRPSRAQRRGLPRRSRWSAVLTRWTSEAGHTRRRPARLPARQAAQRRLLEAATAEGPWALSACV
mmetsp:Transcript_11469/g.44440  ORF Transcript_11469/g.44440 Transcript_11469/m.44440 type:complete len:205 (-) Transcript_11469:69-683(-)